MKIGKYAIHRFSNDLQIKSKLLHFLFHDNFDIESKLYKQYSNNSVTFMLTDVSDDVVGTIRYIYKHSHTNKLPLESAKIIQHEEHIKPDLFSKINTAEIGGLKICDSLSNFDKYRVLALLFLLCEFEAVADDCQYIFATCKPNLTSLYTSKQRFKVAATISYGSDIYQALYVDRISRPIFADQAIELVNQTSDN